MESKLFVVLGAKTEGLQKGLREAEKAILKAQRSFDRAFGPALTAIGNGLKVIGAAGAAGFGALAASGLKANASMEQYRTTLNTVMGDSQKAAETLAWVKDYAAKTPFEMPGLVESTVKLQALGLETQKFLPVAADMAAVFASSGKTVQDAAEALTDAAVGEFERLKEFGIKLGAEDFKAGGKYAGMAYADAVLEEIKKKNYSGAAENLSKTFTGRLSTLKDTLGNILQTATAPVFERISAGMGNLMKKIDEWTASGALQAFTDSLTNGMTAAWNILEKVAGAVITIAKGIIDNWGLIGPALAGVGAAFVALKGYALALEARLIALKVAQIALNIAMGANPAGAVALAIVGLVAAGVALWKNWDTISAKASEIWGGIRDTMGGILDAIKGFIEERWNAVAAITTTVWTTISGWLSGLWTQIQTQVTTAWNTIYGVISDIWTRIKTGFENLVKAAWNWGKNLLNSFIDGIKSVLSRLWDTLESIAESVKDFLGFHSPTKKGPGRFADQWAPNLVNMFAEGIRKSMPALQLELGKMFAVPFGLPNVNYSISPALAAMAPPVVNVAPAPVTAGGGNVTNNYNITVHGHNYEEIMNKLKRELGRTGWR